MMYRSNILINLLIRDNFKTHKIVGKTCINHILINKKNKKHQLEDRTTIVSSTIHCNHKQLYQKKLMNSHLSSVKTTVLVISIMKITIIIMYLDRIYRRHRH